MAKKDGYYSRKWLNKKEGKAFIEVRVHPADKDVTVSDVTVSIGDCLRHITLDFAVYTRSNDWDSTKEGRLYKMDMLISELQKARTFIAGEDDA